MFGPDPDAQAAALFKARNLRQGDGLSLQGCGRPPGIHHRIEQVHGGRADKACHKGVLWPVIDIQRGANLFNMTGLHDDDLVGHCHRLDLVVGDIDGRGGKTLVQFADFRPHLDPKLGIKVRQGFVKQEHLGVAHNRPPHGHSLTLSTRQGAGIAVKVGGQAQHLGGAVDPCLDLGLVHLLHPQGKGHVGPNGLVRVKRVVLEHHCDVPFRRRQVVHKPFANVNGPGGYPFKPSDHPQQCRLSATGRTDQHHEFTVMDVNV